MYKRILVGTNGTRTADRAVRHAAELAAQCGARLQIATARRFGSDDEDSADPGSAGAGPVDEGTVGVGEIDVDDVLLRARGLIEDLDVEIETVVLEGEPSQALVAHAADTSIDLVVVGRVGLGGLRGRILGSVPGSVVDDVSCHVLVVRSQE